MLNFYAHKTVFVKCINIYKVGDNIRNCNTANKALAINEQINFKDVVSY